MNRDGLSGSTRMVLAMALSGTIGWAVTESGQSPLTVVFFRCAIGGAGLLLWLSLQRGWKPADRKTWGWLAVGGVALVLNWLCLFSAYSASSISVATVVYHTQPFMLVVLAALGRRNAQPGLEWSRLPWLLLAFAGVAMTSGLFGEAGELKHMAAGVGLACAAAFLYAVATLVTQKLRHVPPAQIAGVQMAIGVAILLPLAWPLPTAYSAKSLTLLATLGLVHTAFMYTLLYAAFQKLPPHAVAALSFIYPLVALAVDVLAYGVRLQPIQWLGMGLIMLALLAHQRRWRLRIASWRRPSPPAQPALPAAGMQADKGRGRSIT